MHAGPLMLPCPAPDACLALLVRHGATANNVCRPLKLQGRGSDLPLSAEGLRQAQETGRFLADVHLAAVYSSPLLRARQTAEAIARSHALPVQTLPDFIEVDVGQWEDWSWEDICTRWPEEHRRFMDDPASHPYLGGETMGQVYQRVAPAWDVLLRQHTGQTVVVVTHNVVNRVILAPLLGLPLKQARSIHQDNCGVNVIQCRGGETKLITLNSVGHLSEATG
jgi:broad specificity phosphatase PhoE